MSLLTIQNKRMDVARGIKDGAAGVDRNYEDEKFRGVIRGVAVMTKGNVKDYRAWEIDDKTLNGIVSAGKRHKLGLKSRFGHPNMSDTALGTFLGRAKNFTRDEEVARADLYISKTAYETPKGNLADYVLSMAEKDPDAFGTSVVLGEYELEQVMKKDENGKKTEMPPKLRVRTLMAVDAVDSPAANNGMFGEQFFSPGVELSAQASKLLERLLSNPEAAQYMIRFLERYKANRDDIDDEGAEFDNPDVLNEAGKQALKEQVAEVLEELLQSKPKEENMDADLKTMSAETLKKERPDLAADLVTEGKDLGRKEERARCLTIVKAEHAEFKDMGMAELCEKAIEEGKTPDAALSDMRGKRLQDLQAEANTPPGPESDPAPAAKTHMDRALAYQKEHPGCSMTDALRATAEPRKK